MMNEIKGSFLDRYLKQYILTYYMISFMLISIEIGYVAFYDIQ